MVSFIVKKILTFYLMLYYFIKYSIVLSFYYIYTFIERVFKERPTPPKCMTDFQTGSHGYLSVKGVKLHYMEAGNKSKPLLLFIHGFPEFWYSWRYQLKEFSKDYWCVAIDLRGFGYSDKPSGLSTYSIDVVVEELKDFVQLLGRDKFTIIGHDWGSLLSSAFVDRYGDMLDGYVLMSAPSPDIHHTLLWSEYNQFRQSWYVFLFCIPYMAEFIISMKDFQMLDMAFGQFKSKFVTPDDIEAYKYTFSKPGALTHPLKYYRCEMLYSTYSEIRVPVNHEVKGLFILGEKDSYISTGCIPLMKNKYKGLKVEMLKGAGHFIQQENPEEVNHLIKSFLGGK